MYSCVEDLGQEGASMTELRVQGVYAAMLTPRQEDDSLDAPALDRLFQFLMQHGISSFATNGATEEYCLTTAEQLRTIFSLVWAVVGDRASDLCGVGAEGTAKTLELARIAQEEGATDLLLPMPYFFPYEQDDLEAFCCASVSYLYARTRQAAGADLHDQRGDCDEQAALDTPSFRENQRCYLAARRHAQPSWLAAARRTLAPGPHRRRVRSY
jgi:hypothetical protein